MHKYWRPCFLQKTFNFSVVSCVFSIIIWSISQWNFLEWQQKDLIRIHFDNSWKFFGFFLKLALTKETRQFNKMVNSISADRSDIARQWLSHKRRPHIRAHSLVFSFLIRHKRKLFLLRWHNYGGAL